MKKITDANCLVLVPKTFDKITGMFQNKDGDFFDLSAKEGEKIFDAVNDLWDATLLYYGPHGEVRSDGKFACLMEHKKGSKSKKTHNTPWSFVNHIRKVHKIKPVDMVLIGWTDDQEEDWLAVEKKKTKKKVASKKK